LPIVDRFPFQEGHNQYIKVRGSVGLEGERQRCLVAVHFLKRNKVVGFSKFEFGSIQPTKKTSSGFFALKAVTTSMMRGQAV
jgi:hypothetical protein